MKIATWNVNSLKVRLPQVQNWLAQHAADVLVLQELKLDQGAFPQAEIEAAGYQAAWYGQKTYNGVAILTRDGWNVTDVVSGIPDYADPQARVIAATVGDVRVICVYCVNGEAVGSEKFAYKLAWFEQLTRYVQAEMARYPKLVLLGDFNIAPDDRDTYAPAADALLCSPQERQAWQNVLDLGLEDSYRIFHAEGGLYSWWDYRAAMFRRDLGLRIDHILISAALRAQAVACEIDKPTRKNERPSDHAPVILTLQDAPC